MDIKAFLENKLLSDKDFLTNTIKNNDSSRQSVWHAINAENIIGILDDMKLKPYTSQRYWPDGKRLKDNHPEYEDSFWMYGWSTTRNKEYAMSWNSVVFELDIDKIKQQFEVKPFSWNFLFSHNTNNRKEHEEFIVSAYEKKSLPQMKEEDNLRNIELDELYDQQYSEKNPVIKAVLDKEIEKLEKIPNYMLRWQEPHGKSIDLNSCLKGIYLSQDTLSIYGADNKNMQAVINHPMFKGLFVEPHIKEKNKKSNHSKPF